MANVEERFWAKVDKSGDCWVWTARLSVGGYGQFHVSGGGAKRIRTYAHRWAYEQEKGPIPSGMEIDHLCRTRNCVRPSHLEPVKHAENHNRRVGFRTGPYKVGTHCKHGHERTPENTALNVRGHRICTQCSRETSRRLRKKKKNP